MKEYVIGGLAVVGVGLSVFYAPPFKFGTLERIDMAQGPVFGMTVEEAASKLAQADTRRGKAPFYKHEISVSRTGDIVTFAGSTSHAKVNCRAKVNDIGSGRVQIGTTCDHFAPSDGASAKLAREVQEMAFTELVDATLSGREYNEEQVRSKMAGIALKNLRSIQQEAAEMSIKMQENQIEAEVQQEDAEYRRWLEADVE